MVAREESRILSLARFGEAARALIVEAQALADERGHAEVVPLHLLARALERDQAVVDAFQRAGADALALARAAEQALGTLPTGGEPAHLAPTMLVLLERAEREAAREERPSVAVADLLNALTQEIRGGMGQLFGAFGIVPGALRPHLRPSRPEGPSVESSPASKRGPEPPWEADPPALVGRALELRRLLTVLERSSKCHALLVGEPGVGKRALLSALVLRVRSGQTPRSLRGSSIVDLDALLPPSAPRVRGQLDERLRPLLDDATRATILTVPSLERLFAPGAGASGMADTLRSALGRPSFRLVGTTTPDGLRRIQERDPTFLRPITVLGIDEPTLGEAFDMVRGVSSRLETHHQIAIAEGAVTVAVQLAKRYMQDRFLPDSAIDLLDEAAARKRVELDGLSDRADDELRRLESLQAQADWAYEATDPVTRAVRSRVEQEIAELTPRVRQLRQDTARRETNTTREHGLLAAGDVARTLALSTGIPVSRMLEGESERLLGLEARLSERVVGQDAAVSALCRAVRRGRAGLRDPKRPIGSFLFLGPSGVGKTELAKALANLLFDDDRALTRLDMSEFMERHMAQRLIGSPPGYADSEQGGFLTEAVRRRPYSVLLFDEVEKAHRDVFNLLLQVLDEGRLTDGRGRLADFTNTVVIMTSNIGSERILDAPRAALAEEASRSALTEELLDRLRELFRPELLNRIDEILLFQPLSREHLERIVQIQLTALQELLDERSVVLSVSPAARTRLAELGHDPALGARPLRRTLLGLVQDPLAEALLSGRLSQGMTARFDVEQGEIVLEVTATEPEA